MLIRSLLSIVVAAVFVGGCATTKKPAPKPVVEEKVSEPVVNFVPKEDPYEIK